MSGTTTRGYPYPTFGDVNNFPVQIQALATAIDTDADMLWDRTIAGYNQPAAVVESVGVNQSIANQTTVTATFATEVYDNANMVNLAVDNGPRIVSTGIYLAMIRVTFDATAGAAERQITLTSSAGTVARRTVSATTVTTNFSLSQIFFASSGSVITMQQRQNSGGAINTTTRRMAVARIGGI